MGRASAADALRAVLTRQFGASARQLIDAEVDSRLAGRRTVQREDLDAVEQAVLVSLYRDRPLGSTATGSPLRKLTATASAPALLSLNRQWAGDCAGIQGHGKPHLAQSFPSAAAPSIPGTPLPAMDLIGRSWARSVMGSTLSQATPASLKKKHPDHHTDVQHQQGEAQAPAKNSLAALKAGLALQVDEQKQKKERETAEAASWRQVIQAQAEQHDRESREKENKAVERSEERKRNAAESNEAVERRKKDPWIKAKEQEDLDRVLSLEKRHAESQASRKMEAHHKRAKDSLAETAHPLHRPWAGDCAGIQDHGRG